MFSPLRSCWPISRKSAIDVDLVAGVQGPNHAARGQGQEQGYKLETVP